MIKKDLELALSTLIKLFYPNFESNIVLSSPQNPSYGDYATNISFLLAKHLKRSPHELSAELSQYFKKADIFNGQVDFVPKNGFVNVMLSDQYLFERFSHVHEKPAHLSSKDVSYLLEYVSANPTGPLHIGHGRWAVLGDVIASLLSYVGYQVTKEFYVNDAGVQVRLFYESVEAARQNAPIPDNGYHGDYIHDLAKETDDPLTVVQAQQKAVLASMGVTFDVWFSEQTLHDSNQVDLVLKFLKDKTVTYEEEGALWFRTTAFGDDKDRVLIKADGSYTYFCVDLAYHWDKLKRDPSYLVTILGADHHGYVQRIRAGVSALSDDSFDIEDQFKIVIGQLVNLVRDGAPIKMSKRSGQMITLKEVIDEIGSDAVRFFMVYCSANTHMDFDLELAKRQSSENPVYYIQYAHARLSRILRKFEVNTLDVPDLLSLDETFDETERAMAFLSLKSYDVIWDSAVSLMPHKMTTYAYELARSFHLFYERCPIMKAEPSVQKKRLFLIYQVRFVLATCLGLLGVKAPESM